MSSCFSWRISTRKWEAQEWQKFRPKFKNGHLKLITALSFTVNISVFIFLSKLTYVSYFFLCEINVLLFLVLNFSEYQSIVTFWKIILNMKSWNAFLFGKFYYEKVWASSLHFITMDRGAWQAVVHRVAKRQTWLKQLSTKHQLSW